MSIYLANGTELPDLPEWDKEKYPYAWIFYYLNSYHLYATEPVHFEYISDAGKNYIRPINPVIVGSEEVLPYKLWWCKSPSFSEWEFSDENSGLFQRTPENILWCSPSIYYADDHPDAALAGTVAVQGVDPVTDHNALIQGWIIGQRLAAARIYNKPISVNIINLAATYSPYTANMELGELGSLGGNPLQIGHSGQAITYHNGHLTVEDQQ